MTAAGGDAIAFLLEVFESSRSDDAIVWRDEAFGYGWLLERLAHWEADLDRRDLERGAVAAIEADFSPNAVALFLALVRRGCILVPLTSTVAAQRNEFLETAEVERIFRLDDRDEHTFEKTGREARHELYERLRALGHPGLVLFSSGSTGQSKAAVHDFVPLLGKFETQRRRLRAISFLLYDHIGGVNTMLYTLSNGGCLVTVRERSPDTVLAAVAKHRVQLLPTSPTFMNLILLSQAHRRHDISALETVTYGTEPMPESTLQQFHRRLPDVQLSQTYGLSEVGILRARSRSSDSVWVKVGGEDFETRVRGGLLEIKSRSAMLGYLNAPSPFTENGWFRTGDAVETDGEYLHILGRESEIINVGGEKVHPAEVESVLLEDAGVAEAMVFGEKHAFMGQVVAARVRLATADEPRAAARRLQQHCRARLAKFKVPVRIAIADEAQHSARFKKSRRPADP